MAELPGLAWQGDLSRVKTTVEAGGASTIDLQDDCGRTAAYSAVSANQMAVLDYLIAKGANLNLQMEKGSTPLHLAAFNQNKEAVVKLLAADADVNIKNRYGMTPLDEARYNNAHEIAELLSNHIAQKKADSQAGVGMVTVPSSAPAPEVPAAAPVVPAAEEGEKQAEAAEEAWHGALRNVLLSPSCCTEVAGTGVVAKVPDDKLKSDSDIKSVLRTLMPRIDEMKDRTGAHPVATFIAATYHNGLPIYKNSASIQAHTIQAIRVVIHSLSETNDVGTNLDPSLKKQVAARLATVYQSCQAEQGRVIDALYGQVTGRDLGLREQLLVLVDEQKQQVLDQVANALYPDAWKTGDSNPSLQLPHIQSGFRKAVGQTLGLRGVGAARADHFAKYCADDEAATVGKKFREFFSITDLVATLIDDVNQQSADAERRISRESLMKWAGEQAASGFDPHSIFYRDDEQEGEGEEDEPKPKPLPENEYQPFLSMTVAAEILQRTFL